MILLSLIWTIVKVLIALLVILVVFVIGCACYLSYKIDQTYKIFHRDDYPPTEEE